MKTLLTFTLLEDDDGMLHVECDPDPTAADFDQFIRAVGAARMQFQPPVSTAVPATGADLSVVPAPPGWFAGEMFPHGPVLGLRHPAFGWLAFHVPPGFVDTLKQALDELPRGSQAQH